MWHSQSHSTYHTYGTVKVTAHTTQMAQSKSQHIPHIWHSQSHSTYHTNGTVKVTAHSTQIAQSKSQHIPHKWHSHSHSTYHTNGTVKVTAHTTQMTQSIVTAHTTHMAHCHFCCADSCGAPGAIQHTPQYHSHSSYHKSHKSSAPLPLR